MTDITKLQAAYEQAQQERDTALSGLRKGGRPVFAPNEERERREQIEAQYRGKLTAIHADVAAAVSKAESDIAQTSAADPLAALDTEKITRAAAMPAFVQQVRVVGPDYLQRTYGASAVPDRRQTA